MSAPQTPTTSRNPECDALASLLALRATGMLDATESARVDRHLTTCAACQADAALDDTLASRLRHALIAPTQVAPALSMEEIMRATEERVAHAPIEDAPETRPAAERRAALAHLPAAHWRTGLSAIAAVLALVIFATYIFGHGPMGARRAAWPGPTPTLSPLLAQQTVYLPTDVGIYALRASDGALRWTYPAGIAKTPITNPQTIFGLALDHGTLYTLAAIPEQNDASLLALNAATGAVRWRASIPNLWTDSQPQLASLLQADNLLIVATHGLGLSGAQANWTVKAFGAANGKPVWSRALDEAPLSAPVAAVGSIFIGTTGHLVALSAANGAIRWTSIIVPGAYQEGTKPADTNLSVALTASGNLVYVFAKRTITSSSGATTLEANFYAINSADGNHLTRNTFENEPLETAFAPTLSGGLAFLPVLGGMCAISDPTYQQDIKWRFNSDGSTSRYGPTSHNEAMTGAAVSGGVVYTTDLYGILTRHDGVTTLENFTFAIRASDGAELWRAPTNGGDTALTPVVASGLALAPSRGIVKALRTRDGSQLWMFVTPAGSAIGPPLLG